jgi:hypothetical protein
MILDMGSKAAEARRSGQRRSNKGRSARIYIFIETDHENIIVNKILPPINEEGL